MATFQNATLAFTGDSMHWTQGTAFVLEQLSALAGMLPPSTTVDAKFVLTPVTATAMFLTFLCGLLANAGGVGGGPLYIPIIHVLLGFNLKTSAALSITVVSSGALASTLYGLRKTSPRDPNRTLVDFDLALTFIPAFLLGVDFGVLFNVLIPEWLQTALLVFLLYFVIRNTANKARQQWRLEQATLAQRSPVTPIIPALAHTGVNQPLLPPPLEIPETGTESAGTGLDEGQESSNDLENSGGSGNGFGSENGVSGRPRQNLRRRSLLNLFEKEDFPEGISHEEFFITTKELISPRGAKIDPTTGGSFRDPRQGDPSERPQRKTLLQRIPFLQLGAILVLWVLFLVSQGLKARYNRCTWKYLLILSAQVVVLLAVTGAQILYQVHRATTNIKELDPEVRVILLRESVQEVLERPIRVLAEVAGIIALAGVGAGLLGLGGAIFFNPWLLHLGVHPQVTVSTAVLMILFSSSAISLSLSFQNLLNHHYALVFAPIAFVASTIGVTVVGRIVRQSGRTSIIVIILTVLVAAGTITTAIFGGLRSYEQFVEGKDVRFHPLCTK